MLYISASEIITQNPPFMFTRVITLLLCISFTLPSFSQKSSASKTRKMLESHEWELKYYIKDKKKRDVPAHLKGSRLVFMPTKDLIYEYRPGSTEKIQIEKGVIEAEHFKYIDRIEEPEMVIDITKLEEEGVLSFSSEFDSDNEYKVYEKAGKVSGKGYPSGPYEVAKPDRPMQQLHPRIAEITAGLASNLKKISGNLFFFDKNKSRYLIKDARLELTEYGVKYTIVYDTKTETNKSYSYEFMPEHIDEITDVKVDPESRVGQVKITFTNENCFYRSPDGKFVTPEVTKTAYIDYFKESVNSFKYLEENLDALGDAFLFGRDCRLGFLEQYINTGQKLWLSIDGTSSNYQLSAIDIVANKLYIHYNQETVGLTTNSKGSFLTVVPLKDILSMSVEVSKSKPNTLLLHNKKKGFENYIYSTDKKYVSTKRVYTVPLFNYGEKGWEQQRIERTLKQLIEEDDGGEKIKTVYNP